MSSLEELHQQPATEVARLMAVRSAHAQDAANAALRTVRPSVLRPVDTAAEERRLWALTEANENAVGVSYGQQLPRVFVDADGTAHEVVTSSEPVVVGECEIWDDQRETRWQQRQRLADNCVLARTYDLDTMVAQGIMTEAESQHPAVVEAAAGRPVPVPGKHYQGELTRTVG